jgi:hypothetical protein
MPVQTTGARETVAWTGVGRGFADRLDRNLNQLPAAAVPELSRIGGAISARLRTERSTAEQMIKSHAMR